VLPVRPGERLPLRFRLRGRGPQTIVFTSPGGTAGGVSASGFRPLSVRSTMPVFRSSVDRRPSTP
jgi:hypothetical protein